MEERMRWQAFQLVIQIGFRHSSSLKLLAKDRVGWPAAGLDFLEYHFALEHPKESDYDTTADVFSALSNADWDDDMNLRKIFLSGMIASLQVENPARLKPQIIGFIHRFMRQIHDAGVEAMSEEEKRIFLSTMTTKVDTDLAKYFCMDMWIRAIRSHDWRRSLQPEHLTSLESLVSSIQFGISSMLDVSRDPSLISTLEDENFLDGAILKTWVQVIWLHLHIHFPDSEMTQQAQSAIRKLFSRRPQFTNEFRMKINEWKQNEYYRRFPDGIKRAGDKLEEVCEVVTST
jgi:hypothetical protein